MMSTSDVAVAGAERSSRLAQFVRGGLATTFLGRTKLGEILPRNRYLTRGPRSAKAVALTFDDGPHPQHTPKLLDVLAEENIFATFFVVGRNAERYPDLVRRMVREGHAVGNHTYSHPDPACMSAAEYAEEIAITDEVLAEILGRDLLKGPLPFRPPFGRLSFAKLRNCWKARHSVVLWNRDPEDYGSSTTDDIRGRALSRPFRGGDVVLMHDNRPHASEIVANVAQAARRAGLGFVTVDAWLNSAR